MIGCHEGYNRRLLFGVLEFSLLFHFGRLRYVHGGDFIGRQVELCKLKTKRKVDMTSLRGTTERSGFLRPFCVTRAPFIVPLIYTVEQVFSRSSRVVPREW